MAGTGIRLVSAPPVRISAAASRVPEAAYPARIGPGNDAPMRHGRQDSGGGLPRQPQPSSQSGFQGLHAACGRAPGTGKHGRLEHSLSEIVVVPSSRIFF